jgi:hypothetical protein
VKISTFLDTWGGSVSAKKILVWFHWEKMIGKNRRGKKYWEKLIGKNQRGKVLGKNHDRKK